MSKNYFLLDLDNKLRENFLFEMNDDRTRKEIQQFIIRYLHTEQHDPDDLDLDVDTMPDSHKLEIIPKNLYTLLAMNGHYVPEAVLKGKNSFYIPGEGLYTHTKTITSGEFSDHISYYNTFEPDEDE